MEISVKAIIITIMTSIITTVITTLIINYINSKKEKRSEQIKAFKILLSTRSFFNDYDNVKTLNTIDVIFSDVPKVLERWREYYEILKNDNALSEEVVKDRMLDGEIKLLEEMSKHLGYKNINWEVLKKTYFPKWLNNHYTRNNNEQNMLKKIEEIVSSFNGIKNKK